MKAKGKFDVLVANAGFGEFAPLASLTEEHFDKLFDLNVKGTLFTVQKALTLMNDGGSIILIGSVASVKGTPAFGAYGATKAAVRNLVRAWTVELKDRRIRSNVLSPGPIDRSHCLSLAHPSLCRSDRCFPLCGACRSPRGRGALQRRSIRRRGRILKSTGPDSGPAADMPKTTRMTRRRHSQSSRHRIRATGEDRGRREGVYRLAILVVGRPFDLRDPLRLGPRWN